MQRLYFNKTINLLAARSGTSTIFINGKPALSSISRCYQSNAKPVLAAGTLETSDVNAPFGVESFALSNSLDFFKGVAVAPFEAQVLAKLASPIDKMDVEVKPDGIIYYPEIKYRRKLNDAFGPGGWAMIPLGPHTVKNKRISREYALFCNGRYVSQARGEQEFFSEDGIPTATEGCKSNALMRCCKDLGICWELWDPRFIREFKKEFVVMAQGTHSRTGQTKWLWKRKDASLEYPYKEVIARK